MAKTANLYARMEPELKEQAESILDVLGISASNAITLFYKQVVLQGGLPFDVRIPAHSRNLGRMTDGGVDAALARGYADLREGRTAPMDTELAELRKDEGL